jgi:hypothetical protein
MEEVQQEGSREQLCRLRAGEARKGRRQYPALESLPLEQGERWIVAKNVKTGGMVYDDMRKEVRNRCLVEALDIWKKSKSQSTFAAEEVCGLTQQMMKDGKPRHARLAFRLVSNTLQWKRCVVKGEDGEEKRVVREGKCAVCPGKPGLDASHVLVCPALVGKRREGVTDLIKWLHGLEVEPGRVLDENAAEEAAESLAKRTQLFPRYAFGGIGDTEGKQMMKTWLARDKPLLPPVAIVAPPHDWTDEKELKKRKKKQEKEIERCRMAALDKLRLKLLQIFESTWTSRQAYNEENE